LKRKPPFKLKQT